nr:hypothetical protein [Tanacetum cinerariifolium]
MLMLKILLYLELTPFIGQGVLVHGVTVMVIPKIQDCNLPGSGISFLLPVATFFTSSGNFFCRWELYTWQWECLVHFIPNKSDPRVPLILGRPFLRTVSALIDVHREKMILHDEVKDDIFDPDGGNVLIEKLLDLDSTKDLRENLLNINLLIAKIKSLNDNLTPDHVPKPLSPFPIPVEDSDSFLEKFNTSLSYSNNSLPEFKTFINHTEEMNSGSTTTHADYSLPKVSSSKRKVDSKNLLDRVSSSKRK